MKIRNILIGMLLLASVGCSNFLDEFSQGICGMQQFLG